MQMSDIGSNAGDSLSSVSKWAASPFSSGMSALQWVLFLGLIICASWMWTRLLNHFE